MKFSRMDWYPWDFDEDELVRHLTWQEQAYYMRILTAMWQYAAKHDTVDLPDDDWIASGAVKIPHDDWVTLRARLVDHPAAPLKHDPEKQVIYSPRMRQEYQKAVARTGSYSERGKKGGGKSHGQSIVKQEESYSQPIVNHETNTSETEAPYHLSLNTDQESDNQEKKIKDLCPAANAADYSSDFQTFWTIYPRKLDKGAAYKAWTARLKGGAEAPDLIRAAEHYAAHCVSQGTDAAYIKHAKTFLGPARPYEEWIHGPPESVTRSRDVPRPFPTVMDQNRELLARRMAALDQGGG